MENEEFDPDTFSLDEIVDIDRGYFNSGKAEGEKHGQKLASSEAKNLGYAYGKRLGVELGIYYGFVTSKLRELVKIEDITSNTSRKGLHEALVSLKVALERFPIAEPLSQKNQNLLVKIRQKVSLLSSNYHMSPERPASIKKLDLNDSEDLF